MGILNVPEVLVHLNKYNMQQNLKGIFILLTLKENRHFECSSIASTFENIRRATKLTLSRVFY